MDAAVRSFDGQRTLWSPQPRQLVALTCPAFELMYGGAKGGGKLLPLDTPIPTPTGWKPNGDLRPGDMVIGIAGLPVRIWGVSEVQTEPAYELTFSDGTTLVAGESHRWTTMTFEERRQWERRTPEYRSRRKAWRKSRSKGKRPDVALKNAAQTYEFLPRPTGTVRTTREIVETLKVGATVNHSIAQHDPIELPDADLPVPPYTLGAWLGDGSRGGAHLTGIDPEIWQRIEADGFTVTHGKDPQSHGILKLLRRLRAAGVLGDKHVPAAYLRASLAQRLEIVRGLMDTDGWADPDGSCHITLKSQLLFDGVVELLRTLGVVVKVRRAEKVCTNSPTKARGMYWHATFVSSLPLFHLPRKLARQNLAPHVRYSRRFITAARPVGNVAMRCISVETADGLYLAGTQFIPTHNTDFLLFAPFQQIAVAHAKWTQTGRRSTGRAIIFRKNYKNLDEIMARAAEVFPLIDPGVEKPTKDKRRYTFSCGYRYDFEHLDDPDSHEAFQGQQITHLGFDQVEEIPLRQYEFLMAQVRTADPDLRPLLAVRSTANPGEGRYTAWVKERFVDPHPPGNKVLHVAQKLRSGRTADTTRAYIPARLWDNKYLDETYEARLRGLSPHLVAAYIDGDWNFVVGSMLGYLWRPEVHIVEPRDYFEVPAHWTLRMGGDWGSTAPASVLFGTRDQDGRMFIVDELYEPGQTGSVFGEKVIRRIRRHADDCTAAGMTQHPWFLDNITGFLDPAAWGKHGAEGTSPGLTMQRLGIRWIPANNARLAGLDQVRERLRIPDGSKRPQIYIFRRCQNLIRTLPVLPADPNDPEDIDSRAEDHAYDALRYLCMSWPIDAAKPEYDAKQHEIDQWLQLLDKQRQMREQAESDITFTGY